MRLGSKPLIRDHPFLDVSKEGNFDQIVGQNYHPLTAPVPAATHCGTASLSIDLGGHELG